MSNENTPEVSPAGKKAVITVGGCAAAGAVIGSVVPGIGTVIGAGIGGILGGAGVIVSELKNKKAGRDRM